MTLQQCKQMLRDREADLDCKKLWLESSLEEIEFYKRRTENSLASIKDLEKQIKGLQNLIMQLESDE